MLDGLAHNYHVNYLYGLHHETNPVLRNAVSPKRSRSFCIACYYGVAWASSLLLQTFWGFTNVTTQQPVSLHYNFTLRVSTGVYGSRILSSIYILLTLL